MPLPAWAKDLKGKDAETDKKRREACSNLNVLFLAMPGLPGMSAGLYDKQVVCNTFSQAYGVFSSKEDALYKFCQERDGVEPLFKQVLIADLSDMDVYVSAKNVKEAAEKAGIQFDAVFSPYENMMCVVGAVAEIMNLPGNPTAAYQTARHKHNAREALRKAGLATPESYLLTAASDIPGAIEKVGFPMIVKPLAGAGSQGVYIAHTKEDVEGTYAKLVAEITNNKFLAFNPGLGGIDVVCEEFLVGDEVDVDFLLTPGTSEPVYCRVSDDGPTTPPYFVENRENSPSILSQDAQQQLKDYALQVLKAFGFTIGCFHVECMWTKKGPRLIEVNPRMGGGPVPQFHMDVHGCDIYSEFYLALCNIPINPNVPDTRICTLVSYWIATPTTGVLEDLSYIDVIKAHPNYVSVAPNFQPGAKVKGVDKSIPDVLAAYMLKYPPSMEPADAIAEAEKFNNTLTFNITPGAPERRVSKRPSLPGLPQDNAE